ncbi:MAG: N-acetyltransferase [Oscillospiraceae bacterium]|nr:N-acetyltransferase [Oscillospiraceae bacterium]
MKLIIRNEDTKEERLLEEITRESFWNHFQPGADEHFILNNIRKSKDFIKELNFIAELDGKIIGNIVYTKSKLIDINKNIIETITFGPVCILPEYRSKGFGEKLIIHSIKKAKEMGFLAIIIYGDPRYYHKFGFRCGERYDITNGDGKFAVALMALELNTKFVLDIPKKFIESKDFQVDDDKLKIFDSTFMDREKETSDFQKTFELLLTLIY